MARQQQDGQRADHRDREHRSQGYRVAAEVLAQNRNEVRKPGLPDGVDRQNNRHGARQRVHAELLRGHQWNQHVVGAHAESEQHREGHGRARRADGKQHGNSRGYQKVSGGHHPFLREAVRQAADGQPSGGAGGQDRHGGHPPRGIQQREPFLGAVREALVEKDELHVEVDRADRADRAEAADQQQPERILPEKVAEAQRCRLILGGGGGGGGRAGGRGRAPGGGRGGGGGG